MEDSESLSIDSSEELTDPLLEAVETIEREHNMLPQMTYQEVNDYFDALQAPTLTLTSDTTDDVLSLPIPHHQRCICRPLC